MSKLFIHNWLWIPENIGRCLLAGFCLAVAAGLAGPPATAEPGQSEGEEAADGANEERQDGNQDAARKQEPKLSFTDEDLKKYHRPKGDGKDDAEVLEGIEGEGKATPPPPVQGAPLVRTPLAIARPPEADPLKDLKDREAREQFRTQQVETLRTRIAGLEQRLAYLNEKRLAIIDPLRIMPQPQSAEERSREAGLGASELLAAVEAEIASTEAELESARDSLVTIQTRFGAESR